MKQFYETYQEDSKVSALRTQISWTHHKILISQANTHKERTFYLQKTIQERYSTRELERQIKSSLYERSQLGKPSLSTALTEAHPAASEVFRDPYVLEFLQLPLQHTQKDIQKAILYNLSAFILEVGKDFSLVEQEYRVQVGMEDFYIDLLLFHRGLQCLVAIELKIEHFKPQHLG